MLNHELSPDALRPQNAELQRQRLSLDAIRYQRKSDRGGKVYANMVERQRHELFRRGEQRPWQQDQEHR
jgi:hypothetical protein